MTDFTNTYDAFVPEFWSQKLVYALNKSCVMLQCVNKNYEGEIKNAGDTVNILTPGAVSVSDLSGDNLTYSEISPSSQTLVIDQKKLFTFKINDVATAQSSVDLMEAHLMNAKTAIEVAQDTYLLGKHVDTHSDNIIGSTTSPVALTTSNIYENFVNLAKKLKNSGAVANGQKPWVVINPDIEAILLQTSQFTSTHQVGEETLREGAIGRIAGMDVLVSSNLAAVSGKYYVLAGTNDAITFASQVAKIEKIRDINSFSDLIRGLYLYGGKTIQPKALAKLVCTIS